MLNNPLRLVDPSGHEGIGFDAGTGGSDFWEETPVKVLNRYPYDFETQNHMLHMWFVLNPDYDPGRDAVLQAHPLADETTWIWSESVALREGSSGGVNLNSVGLIAGALMGVVMKNGGDESLGGNSNLSPLPSYQQGQGLIDDILQTELKNVRVSGRVDYAPDLPLDKAGMTMMGDIVVGPGAIMRGRGETVVTIAHEEMHLRLRVRGSSGGNIRFEAIEAEDNYVEAIAQRFLRMITRR